LFWRGFDERFGTERTKDTLGYLIHDGLRFFMGVCWLYYTRLALEFFDMQANKQAKPHGFYEHML
jgi:hypothetical protein